MFVKFDYICNLLKPKQHTPVRDFSWLDHLRWEIHHKNRSFEGQKTHPKSGPQLLVTAHIKEHRRMKLVLSACLLLLSLAMATSSILTHPLAVHSTQTENWCSPGPSGTSISTRLELLKHQSPEVNNYRILGFLSRASCY